MMLGGSIDALTVGRLGTTEMRQLAINCLTDYCHAANIHCTNIMLSVTTNDSTHSPSNVIHTLPLILLSHHHLSPSYI